MIESIEKQKLRKEYSYILKSSLIETLLDDNGIAAPAYITYWNSKRLDIVFEAYIRYADHRVSRNQFSIWTYPVQKEDAYAARMAVRDTLLPHLARWARAYADRVMWRKGTSATFCARWRDGKITVVC